MHKKIFECLVKEELKFDTNTCERNTHNWMKIISEIK